MVFGKKWTFLHTFWEKLNLLIPFFGGSRPFCVRYGEVVDFFVSFLRKGGTHLRALWEKAGLGVSRLLFTAKNLKNIIENHASRDNII